MSYSITLFFIPSPYGMDWSSPASLAKTAIVNKISLRKRFMGHVYIELRSPSERIMTGMSSKTMNALPLLIKEKKGFGILFHSFDGHLEQTHELVPEIDKRLRKGELTFSKYLLHRSNFNRLVEYLHLYKEKGGHLYYGLHNRPLHLEGSGCSAFGASFLEIAGLFNDEKREAWSNLVRVPLQFSGSPLTENKISLFSIVKSAHRWAHEEEPHAPIHYWCPDKMYNWVKEKVKEHHSQSNYQVEKLLSSYGVVFDHESVEASQSDFFKDEKHPLFYKSIVR
jgi:hypothetical protein